MKFPWLDDVMKRNIKIKEMIKNADENRYKEVASKLGLLNTRSLTFEELQEIALEIQYGDLEKGKN